MMKFFLLVFIFIALSGGRTSLARQSLYFTRIHLLSLPIVKSPNRIELLEWYDTAYMSRHSVQQLALRRGSTSSLLKDLNELRGVVQIDNSDMALRFVRLLTAYSTWDKWNKPSVRVEIVPQNRWTSIPNFGLKANYLPGKLESGFLGVLSAKAYVQGKFTAPKVETTSRGFSIHRWILRVDYEHRPEKYFVEETLEKVDKDGGYDSKVLHTCPVPELPNTFWSMPEDA